MGNEFAAVLCVESTKLRDGPDLQTCGSSFLANCHLVEPLFVYRFSLAESVVTASTRYYVRGRNLSRRVDKTDKIDTSWWRTCGGSGKVLHISNSNLTNLNRKLQSEKFCWFTKKLTSVDNFFTTAI